MPLGITKGLTTWRFQDNYVERVMDNATYSSAHADDTLVLAGPARSDMARADETSGTSVSSLLAIGALQQFQVTAQKPTQPMMSIGSGRSFFLSGKAGYNATMTRIFMVGRNLLHVLHHNARTQRLPVDRFDDPAARSTDAAFYTNLDSELFLIPFGFAPFFRTKMHDVVGSFYCELSLINSWNIGVQAGNAMIGETVSMVFDRMMPYSADDVAQGNVPRATVDAVLGFVDPTLSDVASVNLANSSVTVAGV